MKDPASSSSEHDTGIEALDRLLQLSSDDVLILADAREHIPSVTCLAS
jgi:hypothetical protein